jgi:CHRD domain
MNFLSTRRALCVGFSASALVLALSACGSMQPPPNVMFKAALSGASEVPPVATSAKGMFTAKLIRENNLLLWDMNYEGLSGPATAAHIHGPATEAQNAGVLIGFNSPVTSPMAGQVTLTPAQVTELLDGKWYVNVHTAANKGGEIRGQIKAN